MANLKAKDADSDDVYLKASGAGSDGDPHIVEHKETSAAAIAVSVASVDTKLPALGQALAAASVPVVLPAATITTLTPPAAITGFATETTLGAIQTAVQLLDNAVAGNELQVDVLTLPALAAGTNLIGRASASLETNTLYDGTTALTPKFAIIDAATSGNNTLVAAVVSKKVRVLSLMLVASGTVNVRFESGADGTALSGQMQLTAQTGFSLPFSPVGWFETGSNTLLNLELSGAVSVDGMLTYVEV